MKPHRFMTRYGYMALSSATTFVVKNISSVFGPTFLYGWEFDSGHALRLMNNESEITGLCSTGHFPYKQKSKSLNFRRKNP